MQRNIDPQIVEISSADRRQVRRAQGDSTLESLLDVAEAAKLLRIHPKTLRTKARHGIIPAVQVGTLAVSGVGPQPMARWDRKLMRWRTDKCLSTVSQPWTILDWAVSAV
jgi:excisionase family DNA binding protein